MKMKHEKKDVLKSLVFLDSFSEDEEYKENLVVIYDYIDDLVTMTGEAQETAKKATELLFQRLGLSPNNRQNRRKMQKVMKVPEIPDGLIETPERESTDENGESVDDL